jgi:hypothetical protein
VNVSWLFADDWGNDAGDASEFMGAAALGLLVPSDFFQLVHLHERHHPARGSRLCLQRQAEPRRLLLRDVACHCLAKLRIDLICDRHHSN